MATDNRKSNLARWINASLYRLRRKRINQKLLTYLVMVALATAAWTINKLGTTNNATDSCRIEFYGLPQNRILVPGITTSELSISFSAKGSMLMRMHGNLPIFRIDLSKLDIRTFPESDSTLKFVTNDDIRSQVEAQMPTDCHFISLKPDTIKLDFGMSSRKKVPVMLSSHLKFAPQYRLSAPPLISPDSVIITGSAMIVDTIECISTETMEISNINESAQYKAKLQVPNGASCPLTATNVLLNVEKFTEGTVEVPIKQLNVPDSMSLRIFSQSATLKYNVGWDKYKKITREMFAVAVDYNDLAGSTRPRTLPLRITKTPDDKSVTNVTISPRSVEYLLEKGKEDQKN